MLGFDQPIHAVVIGGNTGIGGAFVSRLHHHPNSLVWGTARDPSTIAGPCTATAKLDITDEASIAETAQRMKDQGFAPNVVINCTGILHTNDWGPERSWRHFDIDVMRQVFEINTFGVGLLAKHLLPLFPRNGRSVFGSLSARVGSIADNRLGGWYSYRASKAAQNMLIKGISIEAKMRWPDLVCVALHPGTVKSDLSAPFTSRVPPEKLFTPQQSCEYLCTVIEELTPNDSGNFFAWDGQPIPY